MEEYKRAIIDYIEKSADISFLRIIWSIIIYHEKV